MLKVAVGHSEQVDFEDALAEIMEQCDRQLGHAQPQAGILFAAVDLEYALILTAIRAKWPKLQIIGCTTDGEMSSELGFKEDSLVLILFSSDTIQITTGVGRGLSGDVMRATREAVEQARSGVSLDASICIMLPSGLMTSGDQTVKGMRAALGPDVPVFGANAADQWRFKETFQFFNTEVLTDSIAVMLFSGAMHTSFGIDFGWKTVGVTGTVTHSKDNVVYMIDELRALDFYRRQMGDDAMPSGHIPFAVLGENGEVNRLRGLTSVLDQERGSLTFLGDIPEGVRVSIAMADRSSVLAGTLASVKSAMLKYPQGCKPDAALIFTCAGRKALLGTRVKEEFTILKKELNMDIPISGFYAYGEYGPTNMDGLASEFHNETFVTLLLGGS